MSQTLIRRPPPKRQKEPPASVNGTVQVVSVRRRYAGVGRGVLWVMLVVLVLATVSRAWAPRGSGTARTVSSQQAFPDDEARAFAARFAQAYLTYAPSHPDAQAVVLQGMLASRLRSDAAVQVPARGRNQRVTNAWVARTERLGPQRALVTVACLVAYKGSTTIRYLSVPIAQDRRGGLVVSDYPALTSPPPIGSVPAPTSERDLPDADAPAITALLERFLPEYLKGGPVAPEFLSPGARVPPLGHAYRFDDLVSVSQDGPARPTSRRLLATVQVREPASDAVYTLRYRLQVALGDRWLIDHLEG